MGMYISYMCHDALYILGSDMIQICIWMGWFRPKANVWPTCMYHFRWLIRRYRYDYSWLCSSILCSIFLLRIKQKSVLGVGPNSLKIAFRWHKKSGVWDLVIFHVLTLDDSLIPTHDWQASGMGLILVLYTCSSLVLVIVRADTIQCSKIVVSMLQCLGY